MGGEILLESRLMHFILITLTNCNFTLWILLNIAFILQKHLGRQLVTLEFTVLVSDATDTDLLNIPQWCFTH